MNEVIEKMKIPSKSDPRWIFAILLLCYAIAGSIFLGITRSVGQILLTVLACGIFDVWFSYILKRKWLFPLSSCITGLGLSLLVLYPNEDWLMIFPAFMAVASKYIFTVDGKHVYNPGMFGLLSCLWFGQGYFATAPPYQWGDYPLLVSLFFSLAAIACFVTKIRRGALLVSFLVSFALLTGLRVWLMRWHLPPVTLLSGTIFSPAFFLFTFYMITDPKTSPSGKRNQILWGVGIALIDFILHMRSSLATLFISLFIVSSVRYGFLLFQKIQVQKLFNDIQVWLKQVCMIAATGVAIFLCYTKIIHPRIDANQVNFTFTKKDIPHVEMGNTLTEIDARIAHIAKWVLSVGDAVAVGDYDGDGLQDVFLTYPLKKAEERNCLLHNVGGMKFERVYIDALTRIASDQKKYGLISGALFVDYDNSGRKSLFLISGWGKCRMLKNMLDQSGKTTFIDVTEELGLDEYCVSVSACFADFDHDGDLDLFIGNAMSPYLRDYDKPTPFHVFSLPKEEYEGDRRMYHFMHSTWNNAQNGGENILYQNMNGKHFEKMDALKCGMPEHHWTMAVNTADINQDGLTDLYCASDYGPDDLYINQGNWKFQRVEGSYHGSIGKDSYKGMNVSIGDLDNTGNSDIYVSNVHAPLQAEGSIAWHTKGDHYLDQASARRLLNEKRFGWGAAMGDVNLDGWLDVAQVNGMVDDSVDKKFDEPKSYWYQASLVMRSGPDVHSYADRWADLRGYEIWGHQQNRLYLSNGKNPAQFVDVASSIGWCDKGNSRAVALADFDNDGDLDSIVTHQFSTADLFENSCRQQSQNHWIGFTIKGDGLNVSKDAYGTKLILHHSNGIQTRELSSVSGFSAQSDTRALFGLSKSNDDATLEIKWPDGFSQRFSNLSNDHYYEINYQRKESVCR